MKKLAGLFAAIGILALIGYFYMRSSLPAAPVVHPATSKKETAVEAKPSESPLDLRPQLIAKVQDLVKKGSNGLYNLSIHEIAPDVLQGTVVFKDIRLVPDANVLKQLTASGNLPADVFKVKAARINIEGLGLKELLSRDVIDLKKINIQRPEIEVVHSAAKEKPDAKTLYQRLMGQLKHLAIDKVTIDGGSLTNRNATKGTETHFKEVNIALTSILLDSITQYDKSRFLFAKDAALSVGSFVLPMKDKMYSMQVGSVAIASAQKRLTAKNIILQPRLNKQAFAAHFSNRKERYAITIPILHLKGVNWWNLANGDGFEAPEVDITNAVIGIYLDRTKPAGTISIANFPHQMLMKLPLPVNVRNLRLENARLTYEERSPLSGQVGTVTFTGIDGTVQNLTNDKAQVAQNSTTDIKAKALFLGKVTLQLGLKLDLAHYKTGDFSANLQVAAFEGALINPLAEPLSMFRIKEGSFHASESRIKGDNQAASGTITLPYDNLHITPLEKDDAGKVNKKHLTGFFANAFVLKNKNPGKDGALRQPQFSYQRGGKGSFFNLLWKTTLVGILKSIGAPEKLAQQ